MYIRGFIPRNWPVPNAGVVLVNGLASGWLGRNSLSSLTVDKNIKLGWKELSTQVIILVDCISTVRLDNMSLSSLLITMAASVPTSVSLCNLHQNK